MIATDAAADRTRGPDAAAERVALRCCGIEPRKPGPPRHRTIPGRRRSWIKPALSGREPGRSGRAAVIREPPDGSGSVGSASQAEPDKSRNRQILVYG